MRLLWKPKFYPPQPKQPSKMYEPSRSACVSEWKSRINPSKLHEHVSRDCSISIRLMIVSTALSNKQPFDERSLIWKPVTSGFFTASVSNNEFMSSDKIQGGKIQAKNEKSELNLRTITKKKSEYLHISVWHFLEGLTVLPHFQHLLSVLCGNRLFPIKAQTLNIVSVDSKISIIKCSNSSKVRILSCLTFSKIRRKSPNKATMTAKCSFSVTLLSSGSNSARSTKCTRMRLKQISLHRFRTGASHRNLIATRRTPTESSIN